MTFTAALQTSQMTSAIPADEMANYLLVIEWMVKQQQLLKQQQARIEKQQKELEALGKFTTLLRAEETEKPVVSKQFCPPLTRPSQKTFSP